MRIALLLKLAVLALVIVAAFDGANLIRAGFGADNEAGEVARAATQNYDSSKNVQQAYDAAVAALTDSHDVIDPSTFVFDANGEVSLTVRRKADSVVLGRIRKSWTEITVKGSAGAPS